MLAAELMVRALCEFSSCFQMFPRPSECLDIGLYRSLLGGCFGGQGISIVLGILGAAGILGAIHLLVGFVNANRFMVYVI